jgi:hypothetical protein
VKRASRVALSERVKLAAKLPTSHWRSREFAPSSPRHFLSFPFSNFTVLKKKRLKKTFWFKMERAEVQRPLVSYSEVPRLHKPDVATIHREFLRKYTTSPLTGFF